MWYFFSQAEQYPNVASALDAEVAFRDRKFSGLIEKNLGENMRAVMLFAGGTSAGAYLLENNASKPLAFADFTILKATSEDGFRAVQLPNYAMRMVWLSLESQVQDVVNVQMEDTWKSLLKRWETEKWSGLVEVRSDACHGFALFWDGAAQRSDIFFSAEQGFSSEFRNSVENCRQPRRVVTFTLTPSTQAYQCALLRQGAIHWSNKVLMRYQELVGQKLLTSMERELNRQINPWAWNINVENGTLTDAHFFLHTDLAAHAYRAILMNIGWQMSFVLGNNLTQKLLTETFAAVPSHEAALLQTHRLIPAAFSE